MRRSSALFRSSLMLLLVDPLFYAAAVATVLFCSFRFFLAGKFFVEGAGTTDLRQLFQSVPFISIATVPLIVFRLRRFICDDSLPVAPAKRFAVIIAAALSAFSVPVLMLVSVPACVSSFGDVDVGQAAAGFSGVILYGLLASSLSVFLFAAFPSVPAIPLLVSMAVLAAVDFIHIVPLYVPLGSALSFAMRKISFAWHFDSFGKGIADSRDISFYLISSALFVVMSVVAERRRTGRRGGRAALVVALASLSLLAFSAERSYFRADMTASRRHSLSDATRSLVSLLGSPLRITYYRSRELSELYPQASEVADFLLEFSSLSPLVTLEVVDADAGRLSGLGVQGQQLERNTGTKIELVTVYSAVVMQHLDRQSIIPYVLSTDTLEYDLAQRVKQLVSGSARRVAVFVGNGRDCGESYSYVAPFLASRGFMPEIVGGGEAERAISSLGSGDSLLVLGSSEMTFAQGQAVAGAISRGVPSFIATSPYSVPVETEWTVSRADDDPLIPVLNSLGFAFVPALVEDLSCFPVSMQSGEGNSAEFVTLNYPLWLSLMPQPAAVRGMTLFWASPLALYGGAVPLLRSSPYSWLQRDGAPFVTDPFALQGASSGGDYESYVVAAEKITETERVCVVADQHFVSSLMTGFISGGNSVDFRNFDFLCTRLLRLNGEDALADMLDRTRPATSLHKISDAEEFGSERRRTLAIHFVFLPLAAALPFAAICAKRRRKQ